ncbi:MAG: S1 RNA-binding domain-containing protein [Oscillospiraceae bacterium]|nr:S1 RNA-binding domain-containing protein [Oscillospiraceae bacterium]
MQLEQGTILEGKVTGILKFGAFVDIGGGKSGMVHISEVSNSYVNDINEVLKVGQVVKVKVVSIAEDGKISLSIKKAEAPAPKPNRNNFKKPKPENNFAGQDKDKDDAPRFKRQAPQKPQKKEPISVEALENARYSYEVKQTSNDASFEDMLAKFKSSSEDRMSDLKHAMDPKKRGGRRR